MTITSLNSFKLLAFLSHLLHIPPDYVSKLFCFSSLNIKTKFHHPFFKPLILTSPLVSCWAKISQAHGGKIWGSFNSILFLTSLPTPHSNNDPNFSHYFLFIYTPTITTYVCFPTLAKASHGGVRSSCPGDQRQKLHGQTKRAAGHRVMWDWRWDSVFYGSLADTRQGSNRCCRLLSASGSSQGQPRGNRSVGCKGGHGRCSKGRLHLLTNRLYNKPPLHTIPVVD